MAKLWLWVLIGGAILVAVLLERRSLKAKKSRLGSRASMSFDNFYNSYYAESHIPKPILLRLLQEVSYYTDIPMNLLRPSDRFDRELAPLKKWYAFDDSLAPMEWHAKALEKKFGTSVDLSKIQTVDDYIRTFGALESAASSSA